MIHANELKEDSIEKWCEEYLLGKETEQINREQAKTFIKCVIAEDDIQNSSKFDDDMKNDFPYQLLKKRIEAINSYTATKAVILFISSACDRTAKLVMMAALLQYKSFKTGCRDINMDVLSSKIIPVGLPSEKVLENAWRNQKVIPDNASDSDNMLDYPEASKSIKFE